jgi:hypothetical protein
MINSKKLFTLVILTCFVNIKTLARTFTIPDWPINSCVFIMEGEKAIGTGFLLGIKDCNSTFCYLISAKHVLKQAFSNEQKKLTLRFNLKNSKAAKTIEFPTVKFKNRRWVEHEKQAIDLAVVPLLFPKRFEPVDVIIRVIENRDDEFLATSDWLKKYKVSAGDEAFILGLVPYLYTKDEQNLVLTRFGTISLLPNKEISLPGGKQKAYFLDCQAFGGNSGGPALRRGLGTNSVTIPGEE